MSLTTMRAPARRASSTSARGPAAHRRMHDGVERRELGGLAQHPGTEGGPVQLAVPPNHLGAEPLHDGGEHRRTRALRLTGEQSASMIVAPQRRNSSATVDLPEAMFPVSPMWTVIASYHNRP